MSREIRADYETQYLFPRSLEEWVRPDDPARFIREFVRALDLSGFEEADERPHPNEAMGRPHYGFEMLLGVWLYGYTYGIRSSRALERACKELLPLVWLAGTHEPDHNTLWRFWVRYRGVLRKVFEQSVKVAWDANLIGMVLHAVDGTKIGSRSSRRKELHEEDLRRVLQGVEQRITRLEREIESSSTDKGQDDRLPKELQKQTALRESILTSLERLENEEQRHLQPGDPDARMMVNSRGRTEFAFNAQAVADEQSGIIVASDVTDQANDQQQLAPMLDQVHHNVGENAATTVADSGYNTAEGLGHASDMGVEVIVASKNRWDRTGPFHTSRFTYDEPHDQVVCPKGERLDRRGTTRPRSKPYPTQTYHCAITTCPVRSACSRDPRGRVIEISPYHEAVQRNRERLAEPSSRDALRRRGATIERIFAEVKEVLAFRRWTVTGKAKVQAQWLMLCTAINLRRLIAA